MKYGVREICDVVFRAKQNMKVGNKIFYKGEPVIYFDTLKTSSLEGQATTVYAQGGRGNPRLIAWDGERTLTFNMEDALISSIGFAILSGAGVIEPASGNTTPVHVTEQTDQTTYTAGTDGNPGTLTIKVSKPVSADPDSDIYVMALNSDGDIISEPFIAEKDETTDPTGKTIVIKKTANYSPEDLSNTTIYKNKMIVFVDYYTDTANVQQLNIEAGKFGGNFYIEADTLFRDTHGEDYPACFVIPNGKVQSNFTFSMASSGDPSTFSFVVDALPDYTKFDKTKKVLAAIQIVGGGEDTEEVVRTKTKHDSDDEEEIKD